MTTRLIVRESAGAVQVSVLWPDQISPDAFGPPIPFASPLGVRDRTDLRWYLEDYLQAPYAVYEQRGLAIARRLDEWGEQLFSSIFGPGRPGRDAYQRVSGSKPWALYVMSQSPVFLGLPWELIRDPDRPDPIAMHAPISRTLDVTRQAAGISTSALRVLMVIARPYGREDVGYRMVARRIVERPSAAGSTA